MSATPRGPGHLLARGLYGSGQNAQASAVRTEASASASLLRALTINNNIHSKHILISRFIDKVPLCGVYAYITQGAVVTIHY